MTTIRDKPVGLQAFRLAPRGTQLLVYEDNFGFLNISEPEERASFDSYGDKAY